jgi:hypothetical protein
MNLRKRRRLYNTHPFRRTYMSTSSKHNSDQDAESSNRAVWTADEERTLVSALLDVGGGSSFTAEMWTEVALSMGKPSKGPPKTAESCKSKWTRVSDPILFHSTIDTDSAIPRSKKPLKLWTISKNNLDFLVGHLRRDLE